MVSQVNRGIILINAVSNPLNCPFEKIAWQQRIEQANGVNFQWHHIVHYMKHCRELFSRHNAISHTVKKVISKPIYWSGIWQEDAITHKTTRQLKEAMDLSFEAMDIDSKSFVTSVLARYQSHLSTHIVTCFGAAVLFEIIALSASHNKKLWFAAQASTAYYLFYACDSLVAKMDTQYNLLESLVSLVNNMTNFVRGQHTDYHAG